MTLFEDEGPPADGLATKEQVRALVFYGRRESIVRGWSAERAAVVLARIKVDESAGRRRALALAESHDDERPDRGGSLPEREAAARAVEGAAGGPGDELLSVLSATLYVLSDAQLRELAGVLPGMYRAVRGDGQKQGAA